VEEEDEEGETLPGESADAEKNGQITCEVRAHHPSELYPTSNSEFMPCPTLANSDDIM
jgi:hypothetical protein